MRINHNIAALNTYRQLNTASNAQSNSMQKLSSGLRINSAKDDAAGLAISEKMRGQIRGLDQASKNAQDGISLIQTAEGALNETHSILQRMRELSVQSGNDTATDDDRKAIQSEISQLKDEVDRIGNTTEFNTKKLIDGSIGAKTAAGTDNAAVVASGLGEATGSKLAGTVAFNGGAKKIADVTNAIDTVDQKIKVDGADITFKVTQSELQATAGDTTGKAFATLLQNKINEGISKYNETYGKNIENVSVTADATNKISIESGSTGKPSSIEVTTSASANNNLWEIAGEGVAVTTLSGTGQADGKLTAAGAANFNAIQTTDTSTVNIDGTDVKVTWGTAGGQSLAAGADMSGANVAQKVAADINTAITSYNNTVPADKKLDSVSVSVKDGQLIIQSGSGKETSSIKFDNSDAAKLLGVAGQNSATQGGGVNFQIGANAKQTMKVTVEDMRSAALGIDKVDLSSKAGAQEALTKLDTAIEKVSTQRSNLGAFQNRLEHTINNLNTSSENLTAAESRVRDVDYALAS
ncbi:flagellin [Priestia megaterium]|uniref:flagellin N-terminal helical domain-containing protein n=1 Tax=Priestia megaterium TaxID=1404 RepID=UPI002E1C4831|nr:flagellin [Priestia megaterium]MED4139341.1 flagellin [Priestia megaterium]